MKTGARFTRLFFVSFWVWLAVTFTCTVGCKDSTSEPDDLRPVYPGNIILQMDADTLSYFSAGTVSSAGFALVTAEQGWVMEGARITLLMSENFGSIEFADSIRRDTTNAVGRVEFRFIAHTPPPAATQTITASIGSKSAQWTMAFRQDPIPLTAHVYLIPAVIHLGVPPYIDSCRVQVRVTDPTGMAPQDSGLVIPISVDGGTIDPLPPTDAAGHTVTWWHVPHVPGFYYVHVLDDQVGLTVDSLQ